MRTHCVMFRMGRYVGSRRFVARAFPAAFVFLTLTGCGFDPTQNVQSDTQPQWITQDGITWVPVHVTGTDGEWQWVPWSATVAAGIQTFSSGSQIDVLAGSKAWRVKKNSDDTFNFRPNPDADSGTPSGAMFLIFLLIVAVIILVPVSIVGWSKASDVEERIVAERDRTQAAKKELKALQAEDAERWRQFQREKADFAKSQKDVERMLSSRRQALDAERNELEQQKKTLAVAIRDAKLQPKMSSGEAWQTASETIRAKAFAGQAIGNGLVINHFFDPRRSGLLIFQWEITIDRPYPPKLVAHRNGRKIREECGMVKGEFSDRLLKPDEKYRYKFTLCSGPIELPDPVMIELTLPPFKAWEPQPPKPESADERRRKKEAWRSEKYKYAEGFIKDPAKLKQKKAEIDEEANKHFGED
jgi:hypothetical protein